MPGKVSPVEEDEKEKRVENIYKEIGEFGAYQFILFLLIGSVACIPAVVAYGTSFYGAVPDFR